MVSIFSSRKRFAQLDRHEASLLLKLLPMLPVMHLSQQTSVSFATNSFAIAFLFSSSSMACSRGLLSAEASMAPPLLFRSSSSSSSLSPLRFSSLLLLSLVSRVAARRTTSRRDGELGAEAIPPTPPPFEPPSPVPRLRRRRRDLPPLLPVRWR